MLSTAKKVECTGARGKTYLYSDDLATAAAFILKESVIKTTTFIVFVSASDERLSVGFVMFCTITAVTRNLQLLLV